MVNNKKGGNLSQDIAKLAVPFGLIAAQESLKRYLESSKKTSQKSVSKTTPPKNTTKSTSKHTSKSTPKKPSQNRSRTVGGKSCKNLNSV
jgi:hypothetical protein